jgi:hypothetical protein
MECESGCLDEIDQSNQYIRGISNDTLTIIFILIFTLSINTYIVLKEKVLILLSIITNLLLFLFCF